MKTINMIAIVSVAVCLCSVGIWIITDSDESNAAGNNLNITYYVGEGTGTNSEYNVSSPSNYSDIHDAVANDGYEFIGWYYLQRTFTGNTFVEVNSTSFNNLSGNVTLYALWAFKLSVEYELDGGTLSDSSDSMMSNNILIPSDPTWENHEFVSWDASYSFSSNNGVVSSSNGYYTYLAVTGSITYSANWTYGITYQLEDGATLTDDTINTYSSGTAQNLPAAVLEGHFFNGWLTAEGDYTTRIESITSDMSGDLTLYPWFISINSIVGHTYTLEYSVQQGPMTSNTSYVSYRYYAYDEEKGFFVVRINSDGTSSAYWSGESESDYEYVYGGMETITINGQEYVVEVYSVTSSRYSETQYIWQGWIPVSINYTYVNGWNVYSGTYTISGEVTEFDTTENINVIGYGDDGITVSGSGEYVIGTTVTLTASVSSETTFAGWYDSNQNLLSNGLSYSFTVYTDTVVYAYNSNDVDYTVLDDTSITLAHENGLENIEWSITYVSTGNTETYYGELTISFSNGGKYIVYYSGTLDGETIYGFFTLIVDGESIKTFTWYVGSTEYTLSMNISYSDYLSYVNSDISRSYVDTATTLEFVTSDDKYVVQIAKYIVSQTVGMTQAERIEVLLAFVQYIEYTYDSDSVGVEEYFKYPLETLYEQKGDCEDTSILFCAIASAMGYRSAMLLFYGHMAASIEITDGSIVSNSADKFTKSGSSVEVSYYYCETTATGWSVGQAPTGYTQGGTYYYSDNQSIMEVAADYRLDEIDFEGNEVVITIYDMENAIDKEMSVTIRSDDIYVDFSLDSVKSMYSYSEDVTFSYSDADSTQLTQEQIDAIGDNAAYTFSLLTVGNTYINDLGGIVTVHLKYALSGQSGKDLVVYHVADDGSLEKVNAKYSNGYVVFETDHFSVFMIDFEESEEDYVPIMIGIAILALIIVIGSLLLLRKRQKNRYYFE